MVRKNIVIRTQFAATHRWESCDLPAVNYLKYPHRHLFFVEMKWQVLHNDRDTEFILMKQSVDVYLQQLGSDLGNMSCESLCDLLYKKFKCSYVSVFEDNENGAEAYY